VAVKRLPLEILQSYLLEVPPVWRRPQPSAEPQPLAWPLVFGNDRPVEIEVGFGKGLFLLTSSQARPDTNFLGIEIDRKYVLFTATRLAKRELRNVRLVSADARFFLHEQVAPASVQAVHVFFPDPWWKQKHKKRRLFTADFAAECLRVLQVGGSLNVVSDVAEYFQQIAKILDARPDLQPVPAERAFLSAGEDYLTNFERKYRQEGRPIHRASYVKRDAP